MQPHVRLVLCLHNHQPVGNFDGVFEASYQESYLPFLDVYEKLSGDSDLTAHIRQSAGVAGTQPSRVHRPDQGVRQSRSD